MSVLQKRIVSVLLFGVLVFWLMLNYGVGVTCDEVQQVLQWKQFCLRGLIACVILFILLVIRFDTQRIVDIIELSIIVVCLIETVYALLQLYEVLPSYHRFFKTTGSFYNSGPLGGFIVIAIPLVLHRIIDEKGKAMCSVCKYFFYVLLILIAIILPATMSRTAWIASFVSVIYLLFVHKVLSRLIASVKINRLYLWSGFVVLVICAFALVWYIKYDSAVGRIFLWKISVLAICESPFWGCGGFADAYSRAQERYFAKGEASELERLAAGSPDYAFNDYLHIGVEYGVPILILLLFVLVCVAKKSHDQRCYGATGALMSVMIFAFASYPMHLPVFVVVVVLLVVRVLMVNAVRMIYNALAIVLLMMVFVFSAANFLKFSQREKYMIEWTNLHILYQNKFYSSVVREYSLIQDKMCWNPTFLYEYGHSLFKVKRYADAIPILNMATQLSTDPMILNVVGECYQATQQYQKAEECYCRAVNRVPNRLYPHYLLYFLYCEDEFENDALRKQQYDIVMSLKVKKESSATRDLREKVRRKEMLIIGQDGE